METPHYIVDLRPEWAHRPYISFWRPKNAGYAYPLPWAGRYTGYVVAKGGEYYSRSSGKRHIRFAVPCDVVEKMGVAPKPGDVDGDTGPVVVNNGKNRSALCRARLRPPANDTGTVMREAA